MNLKKHIEIPENILFDFDRTLIYLYRDSSLLFVLGACVWDYYKKYVDIAYDGTRDGYFLWHDAHRLVERVYPVDEAGKINACGEELVTAFEKETAMGCSLFPDTAEMIGKLYRRGIRLGVVSSNSSEIIRERLARDGIDHCFSGIYGRHLPFDPDMVKPDPKPINLAVSGMSLDKARTWYVGDDLIDMDAAVRAGVHPIGMATGKHSEDALLERGAERAFHDLTEMVSFIDGLC